MSECAGQRSHIIHTLFKLYIIWKRIHCMSAEYSHKFLNPGPKTRDYALYCSSFQRDISLGILH